MENRKDELVSEISQLLVQYRQEVPGRRRAFPESVKSRVIALHELGLKSVAVARATGLPYYTVIKWRKREPRFDVVKVVSEHSSQLISKYDSVTESKLPKKVATVTESHFGSTVSLVIAHKGIRIEGVGFEFLTRLMPTILEKG